MNTFLCIKKELKISGEVVDAGGEKSDVSIEKYGSKARLRFRRIRYVLLGHENKVRPPVFLQLPFRLHLHHPETSSSKRTPAAL